MAKGKKKSYVVWIGIEPGVYDTWREAETQIKGFEGARYKAFESQSEALRAFEDGYDLYKKRSYGVAGEGAADRPPQAGGRGNGPIWESISVDAACSGNPGPMEYRGVLSNSKTQIFHQGPFADGTNNVGEFLALVHALALLDKMNKHQMPIYSDSMTAIAWVRNKRAKTLLKRTEKNEVIFDLIARAETWLATHEIKNPILKWNTQDWLEIPADFGRK